MQNETYLFVDGNYAREIYRSAMESVFGEAGEIDFDNVMRQIQAFRVFVYDCLDETRRNDETDDAFRARLSAQEEYFARIRALRGVHLQLGTLSGRRPRRQKEVDVLLAVDMLTHGFNRNMKRAVLLSGDLDFRPLVEALVRAGVFVEVWFEKKSAAKELPWAADFGQELTWQMIYLWGTNSFRGEHIPPTGLGHGTVLGSAPRLRTGSLKGGSVEVGRLPELGKYVLRIEKSNGEVIVFGHSNQTVLERHTDALYGPITWK